MQVEIGDLLFDFIGPSTYHTPQDVHDTVGSTGWISGGAVTDAGGATINVAAGTGLIRASDSDVARLLLFDWPASAGLAITTNAVRYVGIEYNLGTPQIVVKTTDSWDFNTSFPLVIVVNEGDTLHIHLHRHCINTSIGQVNERFHGTNHLQRDAIVGGLILGETGTRKVTMSAGQFWVKMHPVAISAFDSSGADRFDRYYRDGGSGFTKETDQSTWNKTQWDDGDGGLATLGSNKYAVQYFYVETDGDLVSMYGQAVHNSLAQAEANDVPPSSLPDRISGHGTLIGRIIFKEGEDTAEAVESVYTTTFGASAVTDHNDLANVSADDHRGRFVASGSQDLTAGTPINLNITGAANVRKILRARFWISANGADVGANVATRIQIKIFNTDGFLHAELNTVGAEALLEDYGEFQFISQDIKVNINNGAGTIDIDDTAEFGIDDLVRIHDGTDYEYQRVTAITDADTLDLYDTILRSDGDPVWSADEDVTRVLEIRDLNYRDEDDTDEIHVRMMPRAGDDNCRLHFWIEYEGTA